MEFLRQAGQEPEYGHVLLNHLPLTGLLVAGLVLGMGALARHRGTVLVGLVLVSACALTAWPTYVLGEAGFDRVLSMTDRAGEAYLKHHQALAERWVWLYYVTAGAALVALGVAWKWPRSIRVCAAVVVLLVLASLIAGAAIADYGGKVRHPEFRLGKPPAD